MSKEAMKLALEALEMIDRDDNDRDFLFPSQCYQLDEAITALRDALAEQPAQHGSEHIVHSNGRYSPLLTHMMNKRAESNVKQVIHLYDEHTDKKTEQYKSFVATCDSICRFVELVRDDERKECAKIAETAADCLQNSTFEGVANAIRARNNPQIYSSSSEA